MFGRDIGCSFQTGLTAGTNYQPKGHAMTGTSYAARPFFVMLVTLAAVPLAAQEPTVVTGKNQPMFQERVHYIDLDLNNWSARQLLKNRVRRATERVCAKAEGYFAETVGFRGKPSCIDQTLEAVQPQIAAVINRAKSGQKTTAWNIVVSAPRTR